MSLGHAKRHSFGKLLYEVSRMHWGRKSVQAVGHLMGVYNMHQRMKRFSRKKYSDICHYVTMEPNLWLHVSLHQEVCLEITSVNSS